MTFNPESLNGYWLMIEDVTWGLDDAAGYHKTIHLKVGTMFSTEYVGITNWGNHKFKHIINGEEVYSQFRKQTTEPYLKEHILVI